MEKLLDLLNEYDPYIASDGEHQDNVWFYAYQGKSAIYDKKNAESVIISKNYGFIGWLVIKNKIDFHKLKVNYIYHDEAWDFEKEILMQLAIQDEPLEFLDSILK